MASPSNGVVTNTFTGTQNLVVASTANYSTTGSVTVTQGANTDTFSYTGLNSGVACGGTSTASSVCFTGVTLTAGPTFTLATGNPVAQVLTSGSFNVTWDSTGVLANGAAVQAAGPLLASGAGTDVNVTGGSGGVGGAVREFTRFLCRGSQAQEGIDPYTGKNFALEITSAINAAGFTTVPSALQSTGSRCQVLQ